MECPRCHNQNVDYFYKLRDQYYCRQCIRFHRVYVDEKRKTCTRYYPPQDISYSLDFNLSSAQQIISNQLVENYQLHKNSLVLAVCGSGKTEIVFALIHYVLMQGQRVCFCIPRKELVIELHERIVESFKGIEIGLLCGGICQNEDSQFVICTMHQLYRYENQYGFDLMIADEVDAFPFYNNEVLNQIFTRCCLKNYVKLSATFTHEDVNDEELLIMNRRYHGYDLPTPRLLLLPVFLHKYITFYLVKKMKKKVIVYVPKIELVDYLVNFFNTFHYQASGVSSHHMDNQETVLKLKNNQLDIIVSTTLLERGLTIEDVQVIVYQGEHAMFDERTLIQIAGRVGRKPNHPTGKVYIIASERTKGIRKCIHTIKNLNQMSA
ncbi:MAG: helicase-related protein [Coprobacillus sp.]